MEEECEDMDDSDEDEGVYRLGKPYKMSLVLYDFPYCIQNLQNKLSSL